MFIPTLPTDSTQWLLDFLFHYVEAIVDRVIVK